MSSKWLLNFYFYSKHDDFYKDLCPRSTKQVYIFKSNFSKIDNAGELYLETSNFQLSIQVKCKRIFLHVTVK